MIEYPRTIRDFSVFIDGFGYGGRATEAKLPELKLQTANHRGSGMDAPVEIDMGMEALSAEVTLAEWRPELITMFGTTQRFTLRPAQMGQDDYSADEIICGLGGRFTVVNFADLKPGNDVPMKLTAAVDFFEMEMNGTQLFKIDVKAGVRIIGGIDQLAEKRRAMGF